MKFFTKQLIWVIGATGLALASTSAHSTSASSNAILTSQNAIYSGANIQPSPEYTDASDKLWKDVPGYTHDEQPLPHVGSQVGSHLSNVIDILELRLARSIE